MDAVETIVADIVAGNGVVAGIPEADAVVVVAGILEADAIPVVADIVVRDYTIICLPKFYTDTCIG